MNDMVDFISPSQALGKMNTSGKNHLISSSSAFVHLLSIIVASSAI